MAVLLSVLVRTKGLWARVPLQSLSMFFVCDICDSNSCLFNCKVSNSLEVFYRGRFFPGPTFETQEMATKRFASRLSLKLDAQVAVKLKKKQKKNNLNQEVVAFFQCRHVLFVKGIKDHFIILLGDAIFNFIIQATKNRLDARFIQTKNTMECSTHSTHSGSYFYYFFNRNSLQARLLQGSICKLQEKEKRMENI